MQLSFNLDRLKSLRISIPLMAALLGAAFATMPAEAEEGRNNTCRYSARLEIALAGQKLVSTPMATLDKGLGMKTNQQDPRATFGQLCKELFQLSGYWMALQFKFPEETLSSVERDFFGKTSFHDGLPACYNMFHSNNTEPTRPEGGALAKILMELDEYRDNLSSLIGYYERVLPQNARRSPECQSTVRNSLLASMQDTAEAAQDYLDHVGHWPEEIYQRMDGAKACMTLLQLTGKTRAVKTLKPWMNYFNDKFSIHAQALEFACDRLMLYGTILTKDEQENIRANLKIIVDEISKARKGSPPQDLTKTVIEPVLEAFNPIWRPENSQVTHP